jgi:hypothetical protein
VTANVWHGFLNQFKFWLLPIAHLIDHFRSFHLNRILAWNVLNHNILFQIHHFT